MKEVPFNRCMGLAVLEVVMSNPNGDPDMESDPRTIDVNGLGLITPVSFKRKFRDLLEGEENTPIFQVAKEALGIEQTESRKYEILESRGRIREEILAMSDEEFKNTYWDARLFGNTFLESLKNKDLNATEKKKKAEGGYDHFIRTGALQVGVGLSIVPIDVDRLTMTNKSGVEKGKDRGMAPLGFRVVRHGVYTIPFFVNPIIADKSGADQKDLDLFKFLAPGIYQNTASAIRPQINMLHVWFAEHKHHLGSAPEYQLINALKPRVVKDVVKPQNLDDYVIPKLKDIDDSIISKYNNVVDLVETQKFLFQ